MGRVILNAITVIALVVCILTACAIDSETMVPAFICAGSVAVLGLSCFIREKIC